MFGPFWETWHSMVSESPPSARFRLAPTPSGYLHAGNALNFLLNHRAARRIPDARLLLRIDDLDADRKRPEYVQDVFDTLAWLGIDYDEGPRTLADFETNWSQHRRLFLYAAALGHLREAGLLFACRLSRKALAPYGYRYPPAFREQPCTLDDPDVAWRIKTPPSLALQDFIVRRRDGLPSYQLASVVDDLHFGITHIIRGQDLVASTEAQLYLAQCLGKEAFGKIQFLHHPVLLDHSGNKLSKSAGAESLRAMREAGKNMSDLWTLWPETNVIW